MKNSIMAIALILVTTGTAIAQSGDPDMGGREGVPPSAGSGSRAIDDKPDEEGHRGSGRIYQRKGWCRWGQDPTKDNCDNLGSGIGN